jgi:hypothetical protein
MAKVFLSSTRQYLVPIIHSSHDQIPANKEPLLSQMAEDCKNLPSETLVDSLAFLIFERANSSSLGRLHQFPVENMLMRRNTQLSIISGTNVVASIGNIDIGGMHKLDIEVRVQFLQGQGIVSSSIPYQDITWRRPQLLAL